MGNRDFVDFLFQVLWITNAISYIWMKLLSVLSYLIKTNNRLLFTRGRYWPLVIVIIKCNVRDISWLINYQ